jgi:hypothetical protein
MKTRGVVATTVVEDRNTVAIPFWGLTLPVRADHRVAGLRAILLADVREFVGACVIKCIDPKAVAEVRHLENDGLVIQVVEEAEPVHDILVRAGDKALVRANVIGQHRERVVRDRQHPAHQAGFGCLGKSLVPVRVVDEGPTPQVGDAPNRLHIHLRHGRAGRRARDLGGGSRNRDLLRLRASRQHQEGRCGGE